MSSSDELYNRLIQTVHPLVEVSHIRQLTNWMWIVVGILQANSIALSKIATFVPGEAEAESRVLVTTIRRWLKNLRVDVWDFLSAYRWSMYWTVGARSKQRWFWIA